PPPCRLFSQLENDGDGAQCLGQSTHSGGLLPEAAVADGERLVHTARRLSADAQLDDDEIGAFQGDISVRRRRKGALPATVAPNTLGQPPADLPPLLAGIQQDE